MKKHIEIETITQESRTAKGTYKVKGVIWDGLCHCTDEPFEVTLNFKGEANENKIKKFLKETDFRSGDVLQPDFM